MRFLQTIFVLWIFCVICLGCSVYRAAQTDLGVAQSNQQDVATMQRAGVITHAVVQGALTPVAGSQLADTIALFVGQLSSLLCGVWLGHRRTTLRLKSEV